MACCFAAVLLANCCRRVSKWQPSASKHVSVFLDIQWSCYMGLVEVSSLMFIWNSSKEYCLRQSYPYTIFLSICHTNESHKDLNQVIVKAKILYLWIVCWRLTECIHRTVCSVRLYILFHKLPISFFFISQLIKEGWQNKSHKMLGIYWFMKKQTQLSSMPQLLNNAMAHHKQHENSLYYSICYSGCSCNHLKGISLIKIKSKFWVKKSTDSWNHL